MVSARVPVLRFELLGSCWHVPVRVVEDRSGEGFHVNSN